MVVDDQLKMFWVIIFSNALRNCLNFVISYTGGIICG